MVYVGRSGLRGGPRCAGEPGFPNKNQSLAEGQVEITEGGQRRREEGKWGQGGPGPEVCADGPK